MTIPRHIALAAAALPLAACHAHFDGYGYPHQTYHVGEVEVNDHAWQAQSVGWIEGGDTVIIEGHISDDGFDPRDGYKLFAEHPILVEVVLDAHLPGVDLDWCIWDPVVGAYTVCAESTFDPETGSFVVIPPGNEFHFVVSSFLGTSTYTAELLISTYYPLEAEPTGSAPLPMSATTDAVPGASADLATDAAAGLGAAADLAGERAHEHGPDVTPRNDADGTYGTDRSWDVPDPDDPIFSGPLFTFAPRAADEA